MIVTKDGNMVVNGTRPEVLSDIISILDGVNRAVENNDIDDEDLYYMFEVAPEVITTFTKNFVKATHK